MLTIEVKNVFGHGYNAALTHVWSFFAGVWLATPSEAKKR